MGYFQKFIVVGLMAALFACEGEQGNNNPNNPPNNPLNNPPPVNSPVPTAPNPTPTPTSVSPPPPPPPVAPPENLDLDGDGMPNAQDPFPQDAREWRDTDGDGVGDNADDDDDGDGRSDANDDYPYCADHLHGVLRGGVRITAQNLNLITPSICAIVGGVLIERSQLVDLSAFANVTQVTGSVIISQNDRLETLRGLGKLSLVFALRIELNPHLRNVEDLNNLIKTERGIRISGNDELAYINGFASFLQVGWFIEIFDNDRLTTLSGFNRLLQLGVSDRDQGVIHITGNPSLETISGFNRLEYVSASFEIRDNPRLHTISGFRNLARIGSLAIPLGQLGRLGDLSIVNNRALRDLSGLWNLYVVGSDFVMQRNPSLHLPDLVGNDLEALTTALGSLPAFHDQIQVGDSIVVNQNQ